MSQSKGGVDMKMGDALAEEGGGGVGLPMTMPPGHDQEGGGNEKVGQIDGSEEVAPSGSVIPGGGGLG